MSVYETPAMPIESMLFTRRPKLSLPPSTIEYGISIAASLSNYFIGQRRSVGFVTHDRAYTILTTDRSERQQTKILETLAFVEGKGEQSIGALVSAHAKLLPKGATVVLLTPTLSTDLVLATDDLQRRRLRPIVILLAAESFGGQPGTESLAAALEARGIPTRIIYCGADLPDALSGFGPAQLTQEAISWHPPALSHST